MDNIVTERFYRGLSKKYGLSMSEIRMICSYPFMYAKARILDNFDTADILLANFIRFRLRGPWKEDKKISYTEGMKKKSRTNLIKAELWQNDPDKYKELYGTWYPNQKIKK